MSAHPIRVHAQSLRRTLIILLACAGCLAVVVPTSARADEETTVLTTDAPPANAGRQRPLWELGAGVAGLRIPDYRGSDQSHSYLLPLPYVVYRGQWLRADRDGTRALLINVPRFELDISVGASVPTNSSDNVARRGMPDLPGTLEIGPNANVHLLGSNDRRYKLDLRLPLRAAFTIQRSPRAVGLTFSPNLNLDIANVAGGWNLGMLTGPLFGDRKQHALFYTVDAAYATADRPAYQAAGGYEGWRALVATSRRFGNAWFGGFVRYDSLRGAAFEGSPLVRRKDALSFGFGVSYVFARSSELVNATTD